MLCLKGLCVLLYAVRFLGRGLVFGGENVCMMKVLVRFEWHVFGVLMNIRLLLYALFQCIQVADCALLCEAGDKQREVPANLLLHLISGLLVL